MTQVATLRAPVVHQDLTNTLSNAERLELESLRRENLKLKQKGNKVKLTEKGGFSVYGMGRFPFTFYRSQWEALDAMRDEIKTFIEANADRLSTKD